MDQLHKAGVEWPINGMSWTTYHNKPDAYLDEAFEVMAQIDGPNGPEYRLRSGTSETVASERELTYRTEPGPLGAARPSIVVH